MKRFLLILLSLTLICSFTACSKKSSGETKKATTKKTEKRKLEAVLPFQYPKGVKPSKYSEKIMKEGTLTELPADITAKYDYLVEKNFDVLNKFGVNLQDIATCCAVEKVTGCYLNYATESKWTTAEEFRKEWIAMIKALPKTFYTLINDPDIPFDTKLKTINKYGYLAYPFVYDIYTCEFFGCFPVNIVDNCHMTYELSDEESALLNKYYTALEVDYESQDIIKNYLSNYIKLNDQGNISAN